MDGEKTMEKKKMLPEPCPEDTAGVFSKIFYWWLNPLLKLGSKRPLEDADLYAAAKKDVSKHLGDRLERHWNVELQKWKSGKKPSLRWAVLKTFGRHYCAWAIVIILLETLKVVQPILLGGLIQFFSPDSEMELWEGYLYAMGVSLCSIINGVFTHIYTLQMMRTGLWMRIAICSLVYKKCLRLSSSALGQTSVGQIVNLMANDAQKLDSCVLVTQYLLIGPVQLIVVAIILWYKIYWSVAAGMAVLVLMLPFSGILGKIFAKIRRQIAFHTDERVRLTNEMLQSMRIVKMYCWEKMFKDLIDESRVLEMAAVMRASYARAMSIAPFFYAPKLIAYFTFLTFVLSGYKLTAEVVFVTLSLYTPVRMAITYYLGIGAQWGSEALVTIQRMQEFLLKEERDVGTLAINERDGQERSITVSKVSASWDPNHSHTVLKNVSFEVKPGELLIVIGAVGAGKTSLLMAILGELPLMEGKIDFGCKLAYVSQQAWVFGASVRENILFGEQFDAEKYSRVVEAAALKRDFELMSDGDQTLVGDRGSSLSGGQKARISLARALYRDADLYLLDDPLSAVDAHVSSHIFNKCICGYMRKKARILITHQLQYLKSANKILILSSNNQIQQGTYEELSQHGIDFVQLLKHDSEEDVERLSNGESRIGNDLNSNVKADGELKFTKCRERANSILSDENGHSPSKNAKTKMNFLSKSYANIHSHSLGDLKTFKPLLSQSMDLRKAQDKTQMAGTLSSFISEMSLPVQDRVEEYVPQAQAEESRAAGTVNAKLYLKLFYLGGGVLGMILFAFLNVVAQVSFIIADWWLAYWCNSIEAYERQMKHRDALNSNFTDLSNSTMATNQFTATTDSETTAPQSYPFPHMLTYLHIFTGITAAVVLFSILRAVYSFYIVVQASKSLHVKMLHAILRSPICFFDSNPIGRILNRFSKDLGQLDELLPFYMYDFIQVLLLIIGVVLLVGIINPWVFIAMLPIVIAFGFLRRYFVGTIRSIKRLEATTKSPVFSHISSTILGIQTIRSYRAELTFTEEFFAHQDHHSITAFLFISLVRWFALRLEVICAGLITVVAFCAMFASQSMNGSMVGLSLNYAMNIMMLFQWGVRQSSEVESLMTSMERVVEYSELPSEAPLESSDENKPPSDWPQQGSISGQGVCLKYKEDGANVLDNLSFEILPSEKIGIVGRTGAGKSSLISLLFRLVEPGGRLCIDGTEITKLGLHDLREKVSIIPQDPVLLTGSVRMNLDPLFIHEDVDIWQALKQVQLGQVVKDMPAELASPILEGGSNLSMGQRQLLCLARAILMCNRILVIDEATANVDPRTDSLIQSTIREQFAHCTVLTIAHRLNTIIDSDRIMVLDAGHIVEFNQPHILLQNMNGYFYKMAEQTGAAEFNNLKQAARSAYEMPKKRS